MRIDLDGLAVGASMAAVPLWVGDRRRVARTTGVRFVADDAFVVTDLAAMRMARVRVDLSSETAVVERAVTTTDSGGTQVSTDLLDYDPGRGWLATSDCAVFGLSLYDAGSLRRLGQVRLPFAAHGLAFVPDSEAICATSFIVGPPHVVAFFDLGSSRLLFEYGIEPPWIPKGVAFAAPGLSASVWCSRPPIADPAPAPDALVLLERVDPVRGTRSERARLILPGCHTDECRFDVSRGLLYVNDQAGDVVYEIEVRADTLSVRQKVVGFDFPHGLDVRDGVLAVTNYGDASVRLRRL